MNASRKRAGFWRVAELLVVLGMVAVLLALLFPAVQEVRKAAARTQCSNNLHLIVGTIMNYGDAHEGLMPVGTLANPQLKADQRLSWIVTVLPYLE